MMTSNTNIVKLNCESNTFSHKYLDEMHNACQRNKQIDKANLVPKFKDELELLIVKSKENKCKESSSSLHLPIQL